MSKPIGLGSITKMALASAFFLHCFSATATSGDKLIKEMEANCQRIDAVCASGYVIRAITGHVAPSSAKRCKPGGVLHEDLCFFKIQSQNDSCERTCSLFKAEYDPSGINVSQASCERLLGVNNLPANGWKPYSCSNLGGTISFGGGGTDGAESVGPNVTPLNVGYCTCL